MMTNKMNKTRIKNVLSVMWKHRTLYFMILPAIITVFIFHYIPLYGVVMAFQDYRPSLGIWGSEWVGLKHFINFVNYPYFWKIMKNTLTISLWSFTTFPLPIIFAIMLNELKNGKLKKVSQMVTYAPHFVSTVVVCSMVILFVKEDGLINIIVELLGGESVDFISLPEAFAPIYTISGLWQGLGWSSIIYVSSLAGVNSELVEAARIDGCSYTGSFFRIIVPIAKPGISTAAIMAFLNNWNEFYFASLLYSLFLRVTKSQSQMATSTFPNSSSTQITPSCAVTLMSQAKRSFPQYS